MQRIDRRVGGRRRGSGRAVIAIASNLSGNVLLDVRCRPHHRQTALRSRLAINNELVMKAALRSPSALKSAIHTLRPPRSRAESFVSVPYRRRK